MHLGHDIKYTESGRYVSTINLYLTVTYPTFLGAPMFTASLYIIYTFISLITRTNTI